MKQYWTKIWSLLFSSWAATQAKDQLLATPAEIQGYPGNDIPPVIQQLRKKPILFLQTRAESDANVLLYAGHSSHASHESHYSHNSHSNHASHSNHTSHYSSSSDPSYTATPDIDKKTSPLPTINNDSLVITQLLGAWENTIGGKRVKLLVTQSDTYKFNFTLSIGTVNFVGACDTIAKNLILIHIDGITIHNEKASWIFNLSGKILQIQHIGPDIFPTREKFILRRAN
jgi:hypothetical protein